MFDLSEDLQDEMPGFMMNVVHHRLSNTMDHASFHQRLRAALPANGAFDRESVSEALQDVYEEMGMDDVWQVAAEWLRSRGVEVP